MSKSYNDLVASSIETGQQAMEWVGRLFGAAQPSAVFGEPVTAGEHTVITASEVKVGMGLGHGGGLGVSGQAGEDEPAAGAEPQEGGESAGYGGGGGGGGVSGGRPVAAIVIGPDGVRVKPIVDITKLGLALVTALGSMFLMRERMRKLG